MNMMQFVVAFWVVTNFIKIQFVNKSITPIQRSERCQATSL